MDKKLLNSSLWGIFIIFLLSAIWHFVYDFSPINIIGLIAPVNESVWEHTKLFFFPPLIYYILQYFAIGKDYDNFIFAHAIALLIMPIFMILFHYGYRWLLNTDSILLFDLFTTLLTIALGSFIGYKLTLSPYDFSNPIYIILSLLIITCLLFIFIAFTLDPPNGLLFET